jgi:aminotransferase
MWLTEKVNRLNESVIREMTRVAEEEDAINLSQGLPDFPCPTELKAAAIQAIQGDENQYSFTYGRLSLRERIAQKLLHRNNISADPVSEITITCGVSEGLMSACLAILEPGDEVILFEPFYENYLPAILLTGAQPRFYTMEPPNWEINFDKLRGLFSNRTKALILNNPMNPTGKCFATNELAEISRLCQRWDVLAITDEIYEDIIYENQKHISLASLSGMEKRTITIMGFSKSYAVTGWRVGYTCADAPVSAGIRKIHDYLTICAPTPLQAACEAALELPEYYYTGLKSAYEKKRNLFCMGLRNLGFNLEFPEAAYYVMADFSKIRQGNATEFTRWLVQNQGVAVVPGSSFYHEPQLGQHLVRFCFARDEKTLIAALRTMGHRILGLSNKKWC